MAESKNVKSISEKDFRAEVLESNVPVLVDFWAQWCTPCRMIAPVVEDIANMYQGKLKVVKVNVDENMKISAEYQITSIPTLMVFKGGKVVDQVIGALPKSQLTKMIEKHI